MAWYLSLSQQNDHCYCHHRAQSHLFTHLENRLEWTIWCPSPILLLGSSMPGKSLISSGSYSQARMSGVFSLLNSINMCWAWKRFFFFNSSAFDLWICRGEVYHHLLLLLFIRLHPIHVCKHSPIGESLSLALENFTIPWYRTLPKNWRTGPKKLMDLASNVCKSMLFIWTRCRN